ncbi:MAG: hypothetical protein RLZZ528_988 [Pseudomonadota bacterium]
MKTTFALALMLTISAAAAPAAALPPLGENTYVTERLIAARVADRIRKTCPDISARILYAFSEARALVAWAEDQGYSEDEIDGFLDDRREKRKIYEAAETYLTENGAVDEAGFCALGRAEIEKGSIIGSLIYEN